MCYQCATGNLGQVHCTAGDRLGYHANGVLCSKGHTNELLDEHVLLLLGIQEIVAAPIRNSVQLVGVLLIFDEELKAGSLP